MKIYKRYFSLWYTKKIFLSLMLAVLLFSCAQQTIPFASTNDTFTSKTGLPDYSDLHYWAAHPWKYDLSDNIPKGLQNNLSRDSMADVFFIHPTTLTDNTDTSWNAAIDNVAINLKTDESTILYQASVFNEHCRIFAPRYRQAHLKAFFIKKENAQPYFDIAYRDIKQAFEFYLAHYNKGRPIIIASHSQGTLHAARLLKEFFEGKPLQNQLVCAYIIGLPVAEDYFSILPPCKDSSATGCFVGWRTFKTGYEPAFVQAETFKAIVINPLTWTLEKSVAPSSLNLGGILKNFNKVVPHVVSAQVHGNILWTSKPDVPGKFLLTNNNYHIGDINLFYVNIRQNVNTRITSYLKNHKPY